MIRALLVLALVAAPAAAATLDDLAWLRGHWRGEAFGGTVEETWLPSNGNATHAVFRLTVDGAMNFSEFVQVTEENGQVVMRFAHFRPDYTTWEGDGPPMELTLTTADDGVAVFEARNADSPDRIVYRRVEGGAIEVEVTGLDAPLRFERID